MAGNSMHAANGNGNGELSRTGAKSNGVTNKEVAGKSKRKNIGVDQSDGIVKTTVLVLLFAVPLVYAEESLKDEPTGMKFHHGWFYETMVSPTVFLGIPVLYLFAVWGLCRFMNTRKPTDFFKKYLQPLYNIVQIVLCSAMTAGLMPKSIRNPFSVNTQRDATVEFWVFVHFLSKYLDFADTFFMIARKSYRQISFLQVFHHATISIVWPYLLYRGWGSGTASYGAFINSVTHVIMYSHYLATSFGINNPFKRYITAFQLAQFASCIIHSFIVIAFESNLPVQLAYMQTCYHIIMLYLFGFQMHWAPKWCHGSSTSTNPEETSTKKTN